MTTIGAKVSVDGLKGMASTLKEIAGYSKEIRRNFEAINQAGRSGGFWRNLFGGGRAGVTGATNNSMPHLAAAMGQGGPQGQQAGPQQGSPWGQTVAGLIVPRGAVPPAGQPPAGQTPGVPAAGGGPGGSTMPWLSRTGAALAVAGAGANMLSGRIGRNLAESVPISAQSSLLSSMYGGMISPYQSIEMQRFRDLGRYGGTRQDQAMTQSMALRMGQTPQQAGVYMQGVGNVVQAMGGTMTAPQVAQATGGFLEPLTLRKQMAQGMTPARVGGQVRNPAEVAKDYIRNYETRRNGGVKLNMFDMINLQTPGSSLRITFSRLYGLDDESLDMIATVGMQNMSAAGGINYNSQASVAAAGMDRNRLGLAATALGTTRGRREASFLQQNEGGMVTQLRIEEDLQEALIELEDATSGLTSAFAALDKVIQGATAGLGLMFGAGMFSRGVGGAGGGGGLLGRALGGITGGGGGAAGGAGGAVGIPGGGGGMAGMLRGGAGAVGAMFGIGAIKTAVNARNWGDIFSATGQGAAAGAGIGTMIAPGVGTLIGAGVGGVIGFGAAGISALLGGGDNGEEQEQASQEAGNLTDKEIIDRFMTARFGPRGQGPYVGPMGHPSPTPPPLPSEDWRHFVSTDDRTKGLVDRYQMRRSTLIYRFMDDIISRTPTAIQNMAKRQVEMGEYDTVDDFFRKWSEISTKFRGFASKANGKVNDEDYASAGEELIDITKMLRGDAGAYERDWDGYPDLNAIYQEYFTDLRHPMVVKPVYSEHAINIIEESQYAPPQLGMSLPPEESGDPEDQGNNENSNTTGYAYIDRMPMAKPPNDRSWNGLDARMKKRLLALFAASGGQVTLGGGGGTRSTEQQRAMFLDRYRPSADGEVEWEGKRWTRVKGAAAAPPGRSMHEIGLAADLAGPGVGNGWLKKNAKRFGLKEFSNVNDEPWHVQPAELPNSRREYEGGDFGNWGTSTDEPGGATDQAAAETGAGGGGGMFGGASGLGGTSLGTLGIGTTSLSALQGGTPGGGGGATFAGTGGATTSDRTADVDYSGEGPLTGKQVAQMLYNQGFRGENLIMALAISKRESGWDPGAFNGNSNTGDKSYGLFQINMIGDLGPARREQYGLTKNEELLDPKVNIRAAYMLSSNGTNFHHWGGYKGMEDNYNTDMSGARSIISSMGLGDAAFDTGMAGTGGLALPKGGVPRNGTQMALGGGRTPLNVNVTIQSNGNYVYDAKQLAKAVRPAFEQEYAEVSAKRNM